MIVRGVLVGESAARMSPFDRVREDAVVAGPNGAGTGFGAPDDEHRTDGEREDEQRDGADGPPWEPRGAFETRGDRGHGEPPFGDPPGGDVARANGPREDLAEQRLGFAHRCVDREPGGQEAVEIVAFVHVDRRSFRIGGRASASSAARIARVARLRRERTVPGGMPSASAASSRVRPR